MLWFPEFERIFGVDTGDVPAHIYFVGCPG